MDQRSTEAVEGDTAEEVEAPPMSNPRQDLAIPNQNCDDWCKNTRHRCQYHDGWEDGRDATLAWLESQRDTIAVALDELNGWATSDVAAAAVVAALTGREDN